MAVDVTGESRRQRVRELTQIREFLFPDGLTIINLSYRQETGQANLLTSRFTADVESRLATIPMPGGRAHAAARH